MTRGDNGFDIDNTENYYKSKYDILLDKYERSLVIFADSLDSLCKMSETYNDEINKVKTSLEKL